MRVKIFYSHSSNESDSRRVEVNLYNNRILVVEDNGEDGILISVQEPGYISIMGHYMEPR